MTQALMGHVLPGVIFLAHGAWLLYNLRRLMRAPNQPWAGGTWFPLRRWRRCDPACVFLAAMTGIVAEQLSIQPLFSFQAEDYVVGEAYTGQVVRTSVVQHVAQLSHVAMYAFFAFYAAFVFLTDRYRSLRLPGFEAADSVFLALALVQSALLFFQHSEGKTPLEQRLHQHVVYGFGGLAATVLLEIVYRGSQMLLFWRTVLALQVGLWFIVVGVMLFATEMNEAAWWLSYYKGRIHPWQATREQRGHPEWGWADHNTMFVPALFAYLLLMHIVLVLVVVALGRHRTSGHEYIKLGQMHPTSERGDGDGHGGATHTDSLGLKHARARHGAGFVETV